MSKNRVPTGKEYHIDSFEKLVNIVTKDNIGDLVTDLVMWLGITLQVLESVREDKGLSTEERKMSNWDLLKPTFIWKDDGENKLTKVVLTNTITGEKTTISAERPESN
jgi:hypothetical protein